MNGKIKLLLAITQAEFGGAQKYVYSLATNLDRERYEVTVLCGEKGLLIDRLKSVNIDFIVLPELKREINPFYDVKAFVKLIKILQNHKPDIVHTNSSKVGFLGRLAAKLSGVPAVIFTAHGFVFHEPMSRIKKIFYWAMEWIAGFFSDKIIVVSRRDWDSAIRKHIGKTAKIEIIYHGLDPDELESLSNKELSPGDICIPDSSFIVGTVANFYPTKGLKYLVEAADVVVKNRQDICFVLVGDGILRKDIEESISRRGLARYFLLLGYRQDVPSLFQMFDLFILPSVKEGFPWVILEAMAAKKTIVATDVGGIPDMMTHGREGILVPPKNSSALADGILYMMTNPRLAKEMGEAARKRVENEFTLEKMLQKTERLYEELIKRNANKRKHTFTQRLIKPKRGC